MAETLVSQKLKAGFVTDHNTSVTLLINDPVDNLDAETVSAAMETMVGKNVLQDSKGNPVTAAYSAKILKTLENTLF